MPFRFRRTSCLPLSANTRIASRNALTNGLRHACAWLALLALGLAPGLAQAQSSEPSLGSVWADRKAWDAPEPWRTDRFSLQIAMGTIHFSPDDAHQQSSGVNMEYRFQERWLEGQWIAGLSLFTNSFGQFSEYAYGGLLWRPVAEHQPFYVKVTAGVIHGYHGQYQDKIPYNSSGFAPGIIPTAGYCWNRYCGELILLGLNALQFTVGLTLP
jgi:hypothetical protein